MPTNRLVDLQDRLKTATADELAEVALNGLVIAWPPTEVLTVFGSDVVTSLDKALDLIGQSLPGWSVALEGTVAAGGAWTCTLRDAGLRDDDEVIGIGTAAIPPLAMILALLQVLIIRTKGYV